MGTHKKLYAFVDESGQDPVSDLFIVSIVIPKDEVQVLSLALEAIETRSSKRNRKWQKTRTTERKKYIELYANNIAQFCNSYVVLHKKPTFYFEATADAVAMAVERAAHNTSYKVTVYVDGLYRSSVSKFSKRLRQRRISVRKVRGVRKDENNHIIRLADALCGLARCAYQEEDWAIRLYRSLLKRDCLIEIK